MRTPTTGPRTDTQRSHSLHRGVRACLGGSGRTEGRRAPHLDHSVVNSTPRLGWRLSEPTVAIQHQTPTNSATVTVPPHRTTVRGQRAASGQFSLRSPAEGHATLFLAMQVGFRYSAPQPSPDRRLLMQDVWIVRGPSGGNVGLCWDSGRVRSSSLPQAASRAHECASNFYSHPRFHNSLISLLRLGAPTTC